MFSVVRTVTKPFYKKGLGKYPPFKQMYPLFETLITKTAPNIVNIDGFKMEIDTTKAMHREFLYLGTWGEEFQTKLFKNMLNEGDVVLDIGSNIGYYGLLASRKASQVYCFEPLPNNYNILKRNIQRNNIDNITAVQKGISNEPKKLKFNVIIDGATCCVDGDGAEITINTTSVDSFCKGKKVDVIKMDIEGHEPFGIKGMKKTIKKHRPTLFTECAPIYLEKNGWTYTDFIEQLKKYYIVFFINERKRQIEEVSDTPPKVKEDYFDLLCV